MKYWYISIARAYDINEKRYIGRFYGAVFIETDDSANELGAVKVAQQRYDFMPENSSCKVHEIFEMPPLAFRDRLLSEKDLESLDKLDTPGSSN
jgi:hypothetical protein